MPPAIISKYNDTIGLLIKASKEHVGMILMVMTKKQGHVMTIKEGK